MRISTKCSIAIHCLIFLAEYENRTKVTGELLAKSTGCNPVIIRNILAALQKEKIITVTRGAGGTHLAADPAVLTLWQIYCAVEPDRLTHLMGLHPNPAPQCPVGRGITDVLAKPYSLISSAVQETMDKITLQELIDNYRNRKSINHDI